MLQIVGGGGGTIVTRASIAHLQCMTTRALTLPDDVVVCRFLVDLHHLDGTNGFDVIVRSPIYELGENTTSLRNSSPLLDFIFIARWTRCALKQEEISSHQEGFVCVPRLERAMLRIGKLQSFPNGKDAQALRSVLAICVDS